MTIRLSKTAVEMYQQCGMKYKLHYIDGWRSKLMDSPLFFGTAIDEALNVLLIRKKGNLNADELKLVGKDPIEVFRENFQKVKIIDDIVDIRFSELARYNTSDLDLDLIEDEEINYILKNNPSKEIEINKENLKEFIKECLEVRKNKQILDTPEFKLFNLCAWTSLFKKGKMLINAYEKEILPRIKQVHSIQKIVHLPSEKGDYITGFIDFIATFDDGVKRVMDNKTSSQRYTIDNIKDSQQLSIYTEYEGNYECGFAVVEKKIRKKEPRTRVELIFGKIEEQQLEDHFHQIELVLNNVKEGIFKKNESSCFLYGKPCPFYELCHNNDSSQLSKSKKTLDKEAKLVNN